MGKLQRVVGRIWPRTLRGTLVALILALMVPVLMLQAGFHYVRFQDRRAQEYQANLDVARLAALTFEALVRDVVRQEGAIGFALTSLQPFTPEQANRYLDDNAALYLSVRDFSWLSPQGRVLSSSLPEAIGVDLSGRDYFREIVGGREWVVSDLLRGQVTGQLTVVVARGIRDASGSLQGVVVAAVDTDQPDVRALSIERSGGGGLTLFDRQGRIVYHYATTDPPTAESDLSWERRDESDQALVREALAGRDVVGEWPAPLEGHTRLGGLIPINSIGWVMRAGRLESEVMAPLVADLLRDISIMALVALAGLGLALVGARRLVRPIARLRQYTQAIGRGTLPSPMAVSGLVEVDQLAADFAAMAEQVEARREALDATISSIADGVVVYRPGGEIARMNSVAEEMLGYAPEKASRSLEERLRVLRGETADGKALAMEDAPVVRALRGETVRGFVTVLHRTDGKTFWLSTSAAPIRTLEGNTLGAVAIFSDITALHELQERQKEYVSLISHDLRNPLTNILGRGQLLARALAQKGLNRDASVADSVVTSANRMESMIQDMLDSTRLEAGTLELRREPTNLVKLLADIVERVGRPEDRDRIHVETPEEAPIVLVDRERIERAITNLLTNALKYSPADAVVEVGIGRRDGAALVFVSDHGVGIPAEDLPHLFTRYFRSRTAGKREGLGLGLYITKLIVEAHGGQVCAESKVGKGSTFYITLPVV